MTEELLKQADEEVAVLLDASEAFDMLNIEPKTGKRLAELIKALADELRCREWQPAIKKTKKIRTNHVRLYTFAPSVIGRSGLSREYMSKSHMGLRELDFFIDLPEPPKERD
jgi:hypothetical protein